MSLSFIPYIKLLDVPFLKDKKLYDFLIQLKRVLETMAGRRTEEERLVTYGEISSSEFPLFPYIASPLWEDMRFPSVGINPPGLISDPDRSTTDGTFLFDGGSTEMIMGIAQLPHSYKLGTNLKPHVHWSATTAGTGTVTWQLEYKIVEIGKEEPATFTTVSTTDDAEQRHLVKSFYDIDMSGVTSISAIILWKVSRLGGSDTYSDDAKLYEFDIHYQKDSLGSRKEYFK